MPQSRAVLEGQLKLAEQNLERRVQTLKAAGQSTETCARDPIWRSANAVCTSLRRRLNAVAAVEAINAAVARRKLEPKPAKETAEPPPAKAKAKKPDAAKAKPDKPKAETADKPEKAKGDKAKAAK